MRKYFGTDGIRGKVGSALINAEFMLKLGWAVGKVLAGKDDANVIIGRDTRNSGPMIEAALQAGLAAAGVSSQILGRIPTPAVAYLTHSMRAQAGIVISASHNPYYDNGVKFFDHQGMKLSDAVELDIEAQLLQPMQSVAADQVGKIERLVDVPGRYTQFCKSIFPADLSLHGLRIVVDCANGATFQVAPQILHELGAEVIAIHDQPDGFNINQQCGATDVTSLQQVIAEQHADVGIALDGDGDRCIMVDQHGEIIDGDQILGILAQHYNPDNQAAMGVVGTVMTNLGLEQLLSKNNIEFIRTPVGDRYVLEELRKRDWILGGESSGHIVNLNYSTTGDGIITALQILAVMQLTGKCLHELAASMVKCPMILINVPVHGDKDVSKFPKVQAIATQVEANLNGSGRVLLRPSGTEPYVRVMVEGNDENHIREAAETIASIVKQEMK